MKEWSCAADNPVAETPKLKEPPGRVRYLTEGRVDEEGNLATGESTRLLDACEKSGNPHLYALVTLALAIGTRKSEIMYLRQRDVDLKNGRITLHDTKNCERRTVPLTGHPLNIIKQHATVRSLDSKLLFPGRNPTKPVNLRAPWLISLEEAGIEGFRFHDLRHSCASYLATNGAGLAEIGAVLGHKTLKRVKRYAHPTRPTHQARRRESDPIDIW